MQPSPRIFSACSRSLWPRPTPQGGFTLIELMFSIVILVILITLAAPSLRDIVRDQRVKTATFDVYASLVFARSEAIKRNAPVAICITSGTDWAGGWTVKTTDCTNASLKTQDAVNALSITGPVSPLIYQGDGRLSAAPTFVVKSAEPDTNTTITARCVRVTLSGRPNVQVDTNKDASDGCQS